MTSTSIENEWENQSADPESDTLGHDLDDWERILATGTDSEQYLYFPADKELFRDEAFVVASPDDGENLVVN